MDFTVDTATPAVEASFDDTPDSRLREFMQSLTRHLHALVRETAPSIAEWNTAIEFLTQVGQWCSDTRQEFILLSDILGLSMLVDNIDHPKPAGSTEGSVLGPFHTHDAPDVAHGTPISSDGSGEPLLALCTVKDMQGRPIPDVKVDIWETDSSGNYDTQYKNRERPDGRCWLKTDERGEFWFKAIKPVEYPISNDGPVGGLLRQLNRHPYRPAHMHFMFEKEGWDHLIT